MDANTLILKALEDTKYQLTKSLEGLENFDAKVVPSSMSARETLAHLYECYSAFITHSEGGKHEWGVYEIPDEVKADPMSHVWTQRERAVELFKATADEKVQGMAMDFMVLHDAYHIGQLCTLRLHLDPSWNPYSIYNHS